MEWLKLGTPMLCSMIAHAAAIVFSAATVVTSRNNGGLLKDWVFDLVRNKLERHLKESGLARDINAWKTIILTKEFVNMVLEEKPVSDGGVLPAQVLVVLIKLFFGQAGLTTFRKLVDSAPPNTTTGEILKMLNFVCADAFILTLLL